MLWVRDEEGWREAGGASESMEMGVFRDRLRGGNTPGLWNQGPGEWPHSYRLSLWKYLWGWLLILEETLWFQNPSVPLNILKDLHGLLLLRAIFIY